MDEIYPVFGINTASQFCCETLDEAETLMQAATIRGCFVRRDIKKSGLVDVYVCGSLENVEAVAALFRPFVIKRTLYP